MSRDLGVPLYEQLKRTIIAMVDSDMLKAGDQLPSTGELCARFGVSHITVTKALHDLAREGVVTRVQGRGTFVTGRKIERGLTRLVSFTHEMARQGLEVRSRVLDVREIKSAPALNVRFGRSPEDSSGGYIQVRRLRFVDGIPACLATSTFPKPIGERLLELPLEDASFYDLLEHRLGLRLFREERWITPIVASQAMARVLRIRAGAPLFRLEGMTYLEGDVPVEATDSIFRGDRFRFVANMFRFVGDGGQKEPVLLLERSVEKKGGAT